MYLNDSAIHLKYSTKSVSKTVPFHYVNCICIKFYVFMTSFIFRLCEVSGILSTNSLLLSGDTAMANNMEKLQIFFLSLSCCKTNMKFSNHHKIYSLNHKCNLKKQHLKYFGLFVLYFDGSPPTPYRMILYSY